jgi:putative tricarboxylic transport membrane protein
MDTLNGILAGFQVCLSLSNIFYCFVGVFIGTLIGVLPGIGPVGTIAILLPATFGMPPLTATIMLAGIYYGAMYGGSTTAILVNIPGEAASVVTSLDGYQMARKGRAGPALGISAMGSFIGGTISVFLLAFLIFPLAQAALAFGPPEYFAVMCLGMTLLIFMARGSVLKAIVTILLGLILALPGTDVVTGVQRFTFGSATLMDGLGLIPMAMGLFGVGEVLMNLDESMDRSIFKTKIANLFPNLADWKRSIGPIGRGSLIGFFLGALPGGGAVVSTFLSYSVEKKLSKHPEEFGQGAIEGVAGPETANNAAAGGAFVPLLALGIPCAPALALLFAGLSIHGLAVGPLMITQHPDLFWGTICSMYVGNVLLLVLNLPLIGFWVKVLRVPYRILMPLILLFCLIGVYSTNNNAWDIVTMAALGFAGFLLRRFGYEPALMILAYVLGPMIETNFRQSLIMSNGNLSAFLTRPISAVALGISLLLLMSTGFSMYKKTKMKIDAIDED